VQCLFLTRQPLPEERDFKRVLVIGGDAAARALTSRLAGQGFQVLLVGDTEDGIHGPSILSLPGAILEDVQGFVGAFDVTLKTAGRTVVERVGFVVAAQPADVVLKFSDHGVSPSERVVSLSEMEASLGSGWLASLRREGWLHVAFLFGLTGESDPYAFSRVLSALEAFRQFDRVQCYVFARQLKVAADGLERRYRACRERGALFFRFDGEGPEIETEAGGPSLVFVDPLLGQEMELDADLLVVDEHVSPPASLGPLLKTIPSAPAFAPYLQPESHRFSGVETARPGILAVGASRGVFLPELIDADIEAAAVYLQKFPASTCSNHSWGPPEIDQAKCTICLTCVRLCPHAAISFRKKAEVDPLTCVRCGICAAECPMKAISLAPPDTANSGLEDLVKNGLDESTAPERIVAFLCSRSAALALDAAGPAAAAGIIPVVVPCAGAIDLSHILAAFRHGAGGVVAAGCFTGNCASIYGTILAGQRAEQAGEILEASGIDPARVVFAQVAANTPGVLIRAFGGLRSRLRDRA